jgi:hypothetical protein
MSKHELILMKQELLIRFLILLQKNIIKKVVPYQNLLQKKLKFEISKSYLVLDIEIFIIHVKLIQL